MAKHFGVDVPGDLHDGLVASTVFGEFRNEGVPVIVPSTFYLCLFSRGAPSLLKRGDVPRWIRGPGLAPGKDVPLVAHLAEPLAIPRAMVDERLVDLGVQRNDSSFSGFAFGSAYLNRIRDEVDLAPGKGLDLGISQTSVARQHEGRVHVGTL